MWDFSYVSCNIIFVSNKHSKDTKIFYGLLLAVIFYSFNSQGLDLIWHGCYTPVGSPWRNAFLWTFLFLITAYQGLSSIEKDCYKAILKALSISIIYFIYMFFLHGYKKLFLGNFIIIICFLILYYCYANCKSKKIIFLSLLFAVSICCVELSYNALKVHSVQYTDRYEQLSDYQKKITSINKLLEYITKNESLEKLYRTEIVDDASRNYNDGYLYNINTLNMYTSTEKQVTWDLFSNLGWGYPKQNARYDNNATMLSRNLSGIKYFIMSRIYTDEYEFIAEMDEYYLYLYYGIVKI